MKRFWLSACAASVLALAATSAWSEDTLSAPRMGPWGFDLAGRDLSVSPGANFSAYAGGTYLKNLVIPADRSSFGSFDGLRELSVDRMHAVLDSASKDTAATGDRQKIGALYRGFMDESQINALGAKPLAADLAAIRAAKSKGDIARLMGIAQAGFGGAAFGIYLGDDQKDPMRYAVYVVQGGLNLPNRDYYLEPQFAPQRAKYEAYVAQMLKLAGWARPDENAKAIVAMETEIAKVSWTLAERRDDDKTYNPLKTSALPTFAPGFPWKAFFEGAGLGKVDRVIVAENTAFPKIAGIFDRTSLETLKAYQAYTLADQASPYLSKAFEDARYEFRDKILSGQLEQRPRWKRGVALVDNQIGEALGKIYVATYFPPESKAKMMDLVAEIKSALKVRIENLAWMGPQTKAKALEKLSKFSVMIAYPDAWRDYSKLVIKDGDLYGNVQRANKFEWTRQVVRLKEPVDRKEWGMTPATVNAYYSPTKNGIVFPAAILQPPFFDPEGDMAVNFGGIGAVIGHEIIHGFDDQGRKSDGDGVLKEWWTAEDAAKFNAQAARFGAQYAATEVLPGVFIKGDQTMGENIADLGGVVLALDAYRASLKGKPAPVLDGMTGDQRVFLGWSQVWRSKAREDRVRQLVVTDVHAPNFARTNVPLKNVDAWYEAFGVKPGDANYVAPENRVRIW